MTRLKLTFLVFSQSKAVICAIHG